MRGDGAPAIGEQTKIQFQRVCFDRCCPRLRIVCLSMEPLYFDSPAENDVTEGPLGPQRFLCAKRTEALEIFLNEEK